MARTIASTSAGRPTHSLKPTGLPESSRSSVTNSRSPSAPWKAEWIGGEITSAPMPTRRISAISGVILTAGRMPPWPGLAPCDSLISIMRTASRLARSANASRSNSPLSVRQPK